MADNKQMKPSQSRFGNLIVIAIILVFVFGAYYVFTNTEEQPIEYDYSTFVTKLDNAEISTMISTPLSGDENLTTKCI